ncbi:unnamed protein product [Acanthoscelides obtectus]|uniref:Uncharacterized protein n=1 Tax=Acanthoscelides obtectus TaxID=200917 RepID=A0A9P0KRX2_ACAOB|nr:unnamed protein product [Acanthoscelides obtectus]CAK1654864.1 hypothetical protein AOBTE_LOCUS18903 [Acanthoscelides obtectus]
MALGRCFAPRNRNSWGPISSCPPILRRRDTTVDEAFADECAERAISVQARQLDPLKEDLADWLNRTLVYISNTGVNILDLVGTGIAYVHHSSSQTPRNQ